MANSRRVGVVPVAVKEQGAILESRRRRRRARINSVHAEVRDILHGESEIESKINVRAIPYKRVEVSSKR